MISVVDPCALRRDSLVSAVVRAGYAWSVRGEEPGAWLELARMTGVVMSACGPGRGPTTVEALIASLHRPLSELAPDLLADVAAGDVRVLVDGELNDEVLERCCERVVEVLAKHDPTARWLPSWTFTRAEMVESEAFHRLYDGASAQQYTAGRRFVVEHPAGAHGELVQAANALGTVRASIEYTVIPANRVYQDAYWWPCPVCRFPMRVDGTRVWCTYGPHRAHFYVRLTTGARGVPLLARRDGAVAGRAPAARPFHGDQDEERRSMCVPESVWRHIVVSGVTELELFRWLERHRERRPDLLQIELYPGKDKADVFAAVPASGYSCLFDVKDVFDVSRLAEEVLARPLAAKTIVLPDFRGESQRRQLQYLLPGYQVELVAGVRREIERQLRKATRSAA